MKPIALHSESAQKLYDAYLRRVKRTTKVLSAPDREEIAKEINSHIYEGLGRGKESEELSTLVNLLDRLGDPEEFLQPLLADKKLKEATKTFNPKHIFQALKLNARNGIKFSTFGLLYTLLITFVLLSFTKLISPSHTGLFYKGNDFQGFGYLGDIEGLSEVMGYWFIPLSISVGAILYIIITLLLKWTSK